MLANPRPNTMRLGIFGGAFDPIHCGHLHVAEVACETLALDKVFFVPCKEALLKEKLIASAQARAAMVALAIFENPQFLLDTRELDRLTPSYALLTLQEFQVTFPAAELFWILGEDAYTGFTRWYHWEEIAALCNLVVYPRTTFLPAVDSKNVEEKFQHYHHQVIHLATSTSDISSSEIRQDVQAKSAFLPESVYHYIIDAGLYGI